MQREALPISSVLKDTIGGIWGDPPGVAEMDVRVYRSTEFRNDGTLSDSAVLRSVTSKQTKRRALRQGDILLEKSGGGPKQPVGRVAWVGDVAGIALPTNFVQLVRPDAALVNPRYLFYVMWFWHQGGRTLEFQAATTGIRNLRTPDYLAQVVEFPTLTEQARLVAILDAATDAMDRAEAYATSLRDLRVSLLADFLTIGTDDLGLPLLDEST